MRSSDDLNELAEALAKVQGKLGGARKTSKAHAGRKYADLESVWEAIRGLLTENGLSVAQPTCLEGGEGTIAVRTILMHKSGQWIEGRLVMPYAASGQMNAAQAAGSALTYARRYSLAAMVGVCPTDDDGESAGPPVARRESTRRGAAAAIPDLLPLEKVIDLIAEADGVMAIKTIVNGQGDTRKGRDEAEAKTIIRAAGERKTELIAAEGANVP